MVTRHAWKYERGEGRFKHCWNRDEAGFESGANGIVGKCANSITHDVAEEWLNKGIACDNGIDKEPSRIYTLYRGVIYELVPTNPGVSWHGYPWRGDLRGRPKLPRRVFRHLEAMATQTGYIKEYEQWLKKYG